MGARDFFISVVFVLFFGFGVTMATSGHDLAEFWVARASFLLAGLALAGGTFLWFKEAPRPRSHRLAAGIGTAVYLAFLTPLAVYWVNVRESEARPTPAPTPARGTIATTPAYQPAPASPSPPPPTTKVAKAPTPRPPPAPKPTQRPLVEKVPEPEARPPPPAPAQPATIPAQKVPEPATIANPEVRAAQISAVRKHRDEGDKLFDLMLHADTPTKVLEATKRVIEWDRAGADMVNDYWGPSRLEYYQTKNIGEAEYLEPDTRFSLNTTTYYQRQGYLNVIRGRQLSLGALAAAAQDPAWPARK